MTKAEQRDKMEQEMAFFIANGGTVKKCPARGMKQHRKPIEKVMEDADMEEDIDLSALPTSLKIRFGIRDGQKE
jgi:hypothetical protein